MAITVGALFVGLASAGPLAAQDVQEPQGRISRLSVHTGEMTVELPSSMAALLPDRLDFDKVRRRESLQFEPYKMLEEMFRPDTGRPTVPYVTPSMSRPPTA
jgi:hypothetical protein